MSKSKVIHKLAKNKFVIDFDLEKSYSLADIDTTQYFKGEEKEFYLSSEEYSENKSYLCSTNAGSDWRYTSPFQTARKPRITSANMSEFTSVIKESRFCRNFDQSPFCRLLNDSDQNTADKYQSLSNEEELNEQQLNENLCDKFTNQIQSIRNFMLCFEQRSCHINELFTQDAVFEIIDEPKVHPLNVTLNALAKVFLKFESEADAIDFDWKFASSEDESEIIITTTGKLISNDFKPDFILSAKVSVHDSLIRYIKFKLC